MFTKCPVNCGLCGCFMHLFGFFEGLVFCLKAWLLTLCLAPQVCKFESATWLPGLPVRSHVPWTLSPADSETVTKMLSADYEFEVLSFPGSGRVFSGTGIWPKYGAGFGKTQIISWREMGFDCYPLNGIHQNLGTGCGIFCLSVGNSEVVLTANENQAGVRSVVSPIRANCIELSW